ncbi:putative disease resistance protein RGA4 [Ananas comosus]|uniref:Disease resistance protein RGA4 n=1 Tax=Ananas comosus TaxID=4615 RepID=A0A6P5F1V6_ANACO|nr:putative disease resistance protein RGA4 [Ananas comosus]
MKAALERINQALPQIHGILSIVERGQICEQNKALNAWLWQLRDAVEEAEDVLDELKYYELEKKANAHDDKVSGSVFEPKRKLFTFHNHSFSDDTLKRLREAVKGLDKVAANVGPFLQLVTGLYGNGVKLQQLDEIKNARETSSFVIENCVLGREKEKKMIVEWLTRPVGDKPEPSAAANVSALAIVGIGGLGKTTLAQLIYHDESVQKYFDALMWVCVSDCINAAMLTRKILEASKIGENFGDKSPMLTRKVLEASKIGKNFGDSLNTLQEVLKENLAKKKFLLILDDVWNDDKENEWEKVVAPLKCGQRGSKILLTTRMNSVADMIAKATKGENEIFKLDGLEENSNLLLFKKHAFAGVNPDDHKSLLLIGKKIAKKLMGCPLAAKVIGGLLNSFMDVGYWIRILKKDIENIEQDEDGIMTLLRLSYQHLPTNLQICFRYCCIFPKDYQFKKDELIYMWLGSGLIQNSRHGERPEDIAGMYLDHLTRKSFFDRKSKIGASESDQHYIMHDLLHALARSVSSGECLRVEGDSSRNIPETVRHICIETKNRLAIKEVSHLKNLRTLVINFRYCDPEPDRQFVLSEVLKELKRVRLLSLTTSIIFKLPELVRDLIHLRYLSLQHCSGEDLMDLNPQLPHAREYLQNWFLNSAYRLYHLQVLRFSVLPTITFEKIDMDGINNLVNLRQLHISGHIITKIPWIGKLTSLQSLNAFNVRNENGFKISELKDLKLLRQLYVRNLENVRNTKEAIEAKLNEKENLALLSLAWTSGHSTDLQMDEQLFDILRPHINLKKLKVDGYGGTRSPYWMANLSLSNLRSIELFNCHRWQQLPPVNRLPLLNYLHLNGMQAIKQVEFSINESGVACAFPSLKEIRFVDMLEWEESVGIENRYLFPQLQTLEIRNCPKLRGLPTLPISLRRLAINNVGFAALPQIRQDCSNSSRRASLLEPSLYSLTINNCQNLTSLNEWLLQQQQHIKALEELSIQGCRKLVHLPVEMFAELLYLKKLTIKECEQLETRELQDNSLPSKLQELTIGSCGDLDGSLLKSLPGLTSLTQLKLYDCAKISSLASGEVLANLTALRCLEILNCKKLESLDAIKSLSSLVYLSIYGCDKIVELSLQQAPLAIDTEQGDVDDSSLNLDKLEIDRHTILHMEPLRNLSSTKRLTINGGPLLESLPEGWLLQNRTSLQEIKVKNAICLQSLPSSIASLCNLQTLYVFNARLIQSLPDFPATLNTLCISDCQQTLKDRCRTDMGLDWCKIAKIPNKKITEKLPAEGI